MAQQKVFKLEPKYVIEMPPNLEEGILYVSKEYGVAIHLCACGCKGKAVTPLKGSEGSKGGWTLTGKEVVTLRPSIGNWSGERKYHAHYYITDNNVQWL